MQESRQLRSHSVCPFENGKKLNKCHRFSSERRLSIPSHGGYGISYIVFFYINSSKRPNESKNLIDLPKHEFRLMKNILFNFINTSLHTEEILVVCILKSKN